MTEESCKSCFWFSLGGYCTISGRAERPSGPCDNHEPRLVFQEYITKNNKE